MDPYFRIDGSPYASKIAEKVFQLEEDLAADFVQRVGNTLVKQAVLKPDCAICNEARIPAPPPPITTASNDNLRSAVMA